MIRVNDIGGRMVEYRLHIYYHCYKCDDNAGNFLGEASQYDYENFEMQLPKVYGNHNLNSIKEEKMPNSFWLSIYEVMTFKEW